MAAGQARIGFLNGRVDMKFAWALALLVVPWWILGFIRTLPRSSRPTRKPLNYAVEYSIAFILLTGKLSLYGVLISRLPQQVY